MLISYSARILFWFFFHSNWLYDFFPVAVPSERAVVEKERLSGAYRLSAYYVAKMIGEAPLVIVLPSVYLAVAYPLLGGSVLAFFGMLFVQMLASLAAQSAGLFFGAALNLSASVTAAAIFTLAAQLLGGYLANNVSRRIWIIYIIWNTIIIMKSHKFSSVTLESDD